MKAINYPFLYEALYRQPLLIEAGVFHSIHAVVFPRIISAQPMTLDTPTAAIGGPGGNDRTNPFSGRRPSSARPKVEYNAAGQLVITDPRFYWSPAGHEDTAVVPVYGMLAKNASWIDQACMGVSDINPIATALEQAMSAPEISKIVLDIASPGGQVTGIRELAGMVRAASQMPGKTVYAFTDERCASAAYWLASQANEVYATPSSTVGSIGTYLAWLDESVKMQLEGVRLEFFGAGEHKGMGLPGKALSQADRALLQARVQEINGWFTSSVQAARPAVAGATMQGQTFTGEQSLDTHLVDGLVNTWQEFVGLL